MTNALFDRLLDRPGGIGPMWRVELEHGKEIQRLAEAIFMRSYTTWEAAYEAARIAFDRGYRLSPEAAI